MNPLLMGLVIVGLVGLFAATARTRFRLLQAGAPTFESRMDDVGARLGRVWTFAIFQKKMRYYLFAGLAHQTIFAGFVVLLLRSLVLWGRGFVPDFNLWILGPDGFLGIPLGEIYSFLKDVFASLVLLGCGVFIYYRTLNKQKRMALSTEGLVILFIIVIMMVSDMVYDGASLALRPLVGAGCGTSVAEPWCEAAGTVVAPLAPSIEAVQWHAFPDPAGSALAVVFEALSPAVLIGVAHAGFWTHSVLLLVFLNLLPRSKHFHVITAIPNVFFSDLTHPGRLRPLAQNTESLMELVESASEADDMNAARIGYARIEHFSWKDVLDMYTCTECGRCSDNCPAATTGKKLSPKHLTLDLRDFLYQHQEELIARSSGAGAAGEGAENAPPASDEPGDAATSKVDANIVSDVIDPDVIWACTTCRACEEQCPVMITYVDKIVQMRRNQVVINGEFPAELAKPFEGMEVNGNPWNLSRMDRATWAEGLDVPMASEKPSAPVLYWVGCAASYDDRAKSIARNTARLLQAAGVDFAILGEEESCTGDPARRAGNEYLFSMLAEANIETLNGYQEQGLKQILTTCPHCFNTLANEYPDFGGRYEVVHHADFLLRLVAEGRLKPSKAVSARVTYHDSCYLGRYNEIYESPRKILSAIPGVELVEPEATRNKGLCCGAGGAQMWMEEQNKDRVNVKRTKQLLATGAEVVSSACPFCMTMLTDGLKSLESETAVRQLDVVELLAESCLPDAS